MQHSVQHIYTKFTCSSKYYTIDPPLSISHKVVH